MNGFIFRGQKTFDLTTKSENKLTALLIYGTTKPSILFLIRANLVLSLCERVLFFFVGQLLTIHSFGKYCAQRKGAEIKINPNQFQHQTEQTIY